MSQNSVTDTNTGFIEINRTFHELSENDAEDGLAAYSRLYGSNRLCWPDLLKEYRVVILSEAGTGKTAEIRNIAQTLRSRGRAAFFLRLEHIPQDFEDAFEIGGYAEYEEWLASAEEGWLLLDSVDEARLRHPRDFELAIRKLGKTIQSAFNRAHIVITGRTIAWRPKTDLGHCNTRLPYGGPDNSESNLQAENDSSDGHVHLKTNTTGKAQSGFKFFAFDDLTRDQTAVFADARGINNVNSFLDAVERADAWKFTSRPQDLEELTDFWLDRGRIGSRLELMQNSIDRRLTERDQDRADTRPLSVERARQGARLLSAATTLTKDSTIRVPDGADNTKGFAAQSVLTDWDDQDLSTLLSRPIFDEAIYGTVRFHHRSVREYLTAEWFTELFMSETSRRTIEALFFRNQYGLDIVTPTLRPVLPWLAILDEKIRQRVHEGELEIFFEGGDPSQLPLELRRKLLHEVCEHIADGTAEHTVQEYSAVQRFASPDLTEDVRTLLQRYANDEELTAFLLRMVWLGQLVDAKPEAMNVALKQDAELYTRISALRAVKSIGTKEDIDLIRHCFLAEAAVLNGKWLAELVEDLQPTEQGLEWLLACLNKSEPIDDYTANHLTSSMAKFVDAIEVKLLPRLVAGFNELLSLSPMIERRNREVSERHQWLMAPACEVARRLIMVRHSASLKPSALAILHKYSVVSGYGNGAIDESGAKFSEIVPAWKELNRTFFWFEVRRSRETLANKSEERVTSHWQVSVFGSLWHFNEDDFDYIAGEISRQTLLDNKLVALSLAFDLYKAADRPRAWRAKLKKLTSENDDLSLRLQTYLRPPAQSEDSRKWKQREAEWEKIREARERSQEQHHAYWRRHFNDNLEKDRAALCEEPWTVPNSVFYLFEQIRDKNNQSGRWAEYNWHTIIPEYGEDVAQFYRDATVSFWRHHEPELRSDGAPFNKTTYAVIIGLIGLEIEAHETKDWPRNLDQVEVERACRYASFELNGFPTWFPKLFETYSRIVADFLMHEIQFELSIEKAEAAEHYMLSDVSWTGQWAWDRLAPDIYDLLKREPKNLNNLDGLLKILQGSSFSDNLIEKLASRKSRMLRKLDHLAHWYAVWTGVAPGEAIESLEARARGIDTSEERTSFAMTYLTHLLGGRGSDEAAVRQGFKTPEHLRLLYLLMHEYIRPEDDINHIGEGVYSPGLRDHAQEARDSLFSLLKQIPGKESFLAMFDIARSHPKEASRSWFMRQVNKKAEQEGDIEPWSPLQVKDFHEMLESTPDNHRELAELAILRLLDLKDDLERGDSSIAGILKTVTQETEMRNYIGRELRKSARGRYSIPQEEELADAKRPDLRFHGMGFDAPVPVELKLADKWTGPALFERLENQLCADYLRDSRSNRGIFLLVYRGRRKKHWKIPDSSDSADFKELAVALQDYWERISPGYANVEYIKVIGIDLTARDRRGC